LEFIEMSQSSELRQRIKEVMVEELMLEDEPASIGDTTPIFGAGGLGLDSVDALQLVVALDKHFGLKIGDAAKAKDILTSVETIAVEIEKSA
jgi:acyl carrier protein